MKRTFYSLVLLLGLVLTPALGAAAQPLPTDTSFTSEVAGVDVDLGTSGDIAFIPEDYNLNETNSFREEFIWFTYGYSNFQLAFVAGPVTAEEYHDITLDNMSAFYDSFELVDEEIGDDGSWFLGTAEIGGSPLVVFYEYELDVFDDIDMMVMQFTIDTELANDLSVVQSEVTVDGNPLLPNTDAQMLSGLLGAESEGSTPETEDDDTGLSSGRGDGVATDDEDDSGDTSTGTSRTSRTSGETGDDESTPEVDEDADDGTSTSRTSRTSRTSDSDDPETNTSETSGTDRVSDSEDEDTTQPDRQSRTGRLDSDDTTPEADDDSTPEADDTTTSGDLGGWEDLGLISESEWESPTHGTVITWDTINWEFPTDYDEAIYVDEDEAFDVLTLQTTDGLGYVYITVEEDTGITPSELTSFWMSPEYAEGFTNEITVIETATSANTASVVYETTNSRDQSLFVVLEATFMDDGTVIYSQISAAPETIQNVYGQYIEGVEANGDTIETTWTVEDIQDLAGN